MRALHLPGSADGQTPPYSFPSNLPAPSALKYSASFPDPQPPPNLNTHTYLITVTSTAFTRGELTWDEVLAPSRFQPHGGAIPGHDVVGTIRSVYPSPTSSTPPAFSPGAKVWGLVDFDRNGAASSLCLAYENELAPLPSPPTDAPPDWDLQLTTLPLSALTAYQAIFVHGSLGTGLSDTLFTSPSPSTTAPRILILGPTGSVGLPTLHLALACNLNITLLTSSRHTEFLSSLAPSATIIDTSSPTYTDLPSYFSQHSLDPVDIVIDNIGSTTLQNLLLNPSPVIKSGGKVVTLVAPITVYGPDLEQKINQACAQSNCSVEFFIVKPNTSHLRILGKLAEQRKLPGYVDAVFPLKRGREAMEMVEGRRGRGKVVIRVEE